MRDFEYLNTARKGRKFYSTLNSTQGAYELQKTIGDKKPLQEPVNQIDDKHHNSTHSSLKDTSLPKQQIKLSKNKNIKKSAEHLGRWTDQVKRELFV